MRALVRKVLGYISGNAESAMGDGASDEGRADPLGALWVRDYMSQPAQWAKTITPSDSVVNTVPFSRLLVGGSGNLELTLLASDGATTSVVIFTSLTAGQELRISSSAVKYVNATNTTVSAVLGVG